MDDEYPPPVLPPPYSARKVALSDGVFWVIYGSAAGGVWLDCEGVPQYFVPSISLNSLKAETYNNAKAHIEALAALGEL